MAQQTLVSEAQTEVDPINEDLELQTPTLDIGDGGLLSKEPCGPPCFWNIVPGETTVGETLDILEIKNLADGCTILDNEMAATRSLYCPWNLNLGINLELGKDVVESISYRPSYKIVVSELIEMYGEPGAVFVVDIGLPHEYYDTIMMLYYDEVYMHVDLPEQEEGYELLPSTQVEGLIYYEELVYRRNKQRYSSNWHGYGEYDVTNTEF